MMKKHTLWGENFGLLMASASPGSALAYHLGQVELQASILHRSIPADPSAMPCEAAVASTATGPVSDATPLPLWHGLREALRRFAQWSFERECERHLAQSAEVHQLEARLHRLYRDPFLSRARALR
jgi:hypothetical protein